MGHLLISREERVLRLTLNKPDRGNVLDEHLCRQLLDALAAAGRERAVGSILIDAAGAAFSGGLDLDEVLLPDSSGRAEILEKLLTFGLHYHKPIVAAVQGAAFGAALGLIANAHVVIAAQGTQFGLTEIRLGLWPFVAQRALALAIGERRTVELSLTGRIFTTQEAIAYGLVHEAAPAFELDDRASATARLLAYNSQETLRRGLDFVQKSRELSWQTAGIVAAEMDAKNLRSPDAAEGIRAYREKRKPEWPSLK